ncbi:MAG: SlyX family protein [Devosia sp.]|nr:SlyX family protein [Devosia sp.]
MTDVSERLEKLEMLAAYQEQAIEELNGIVTEQWKEISALRRLAGNLGERLRELGDNPVFAGAAEPPPPHY